MSDDKKKKKKTKVLDLRGKSVDEVLEILTKMKEKMEAEKKKREEEKEDEIPDDVTWN